MVCVSSRSPNALRLMRKGARLADRFGVRLMLSTYLAIWSLLTGLMGFAQGFLMLVLFRLGCGLFEAGAYPACAGLIRRWIPYERRGMASGIVSFGGRIGGTVAPLATAYLMLMFLPINNLTPFLIARAQESTGSYVVVLLDFAVLVLIGGAVSLLMREKRRGLETGPGEAAGVARGLT